MLDVYVSGMFVVGLITLCCVFVVMIIGLMENERRQGFVIASTVLAAGIAVALLWPLIPVLLVFTVPGFIGWGFFNLARTVKHRSFAPSDWS